MTKTLISDIIVPEIYSPYLIERTATLSAFFQSGLVERSPFYDNLLSGGGKTFNMPFFQSYSGACEVLADSSPLTAGAVTAAKDIAVRLSRGKYISVNGLAKDLSGADPMMAMANLRAEYWNIQLNNMIINTIKGAVIGTNMTDHVLDISGLSGALANISASTVVDACTKLGDSAGKLNIIIMHSATFAKIQKDQLIAYLPTANVNIMIPTYLGKRVIVDDSCPVPSSGVYATFLCGEGAVAFGTTGFDVKSDYDVASDDTVMAERSHFIIHPKGVSFTSASVAADSPSDAELATAANWSRVSETKNIAIVKLVHKLYNT